MNTDIVSNSLENFDFELVTIHPKLGNKVKVKFNQDIDRKTITEVKKVIEDGFLSEYGWHKECIEHLIYQASNTKDVKIIGIIYYLDTNNYPLKRNFITLASGFLAVCMLLCLMKVDLSYAFLYPITLLYVSYHRMISE